MITQTLVKAFLCISDFTVIVGGHDGSRLNTVEVVSPDPLSHEVPQCFKTLGNFPTSIYNAVGTTFGKSNRKWKLKGRRGLIR